MLFLIKVTVVGCPVLFDFIANLKRCHVRILFSHQSLLNPPHSFLSFSLYLLFKVLFFMYIIIVIHNPKSDCQSNLKLNEFYILYNIIQFFKIK